MNGGTIGIRLFSRQPLSALSKTVIVALLIITVFWALLSAISGQVALYVSAAIMLGMAVLVATGLRWAPLLASLWSLPILYAFLFASSFPVYHLAHPKDALQTPTISFIMFVVIVLLLACMLVTIGAGSAAFFQNYRQGECKTPRWYVPTLTGVLGVIVGAIIIGAFAPSSTAASTTTTTTNGVPTVHLGAVNFTQSSVTVPKGSKLMIVDDGTFHHNLSTGTWVNGQPQPENQAGEPAVKNLDFDQAGKSVQIGPFTTAGTYHLYCSIHAGMTLTIVVQ